MAGNGSFKVGDCLVERDLDRISRESVAVTVRPQVMDVLVYLASRGGQIVHADELLEELWPEKVVTSASIYNCITELRHAFQDCDDGQPYIDTVPKRGYRIVAPVTGLNESKAAASRYTAPPFSWWTTFIVSSLLVAAVLLFAWYTWWPAAPTDKSIAVLPLVNMSSDPEQEYFSDGLSEEILNLLTKIPSLKVIGRTSSFAFKGKNTDLRDIGQALGVKTLLEGSVRKSGDRVRITVQLVDVSDGSHIWSETYDRTMTDIFAVQDDVAAAIIDALQIHVSTVTTRGRPTENMQAYGLFLKARVAINNDDYQSSAAHSLKAVEFDSNFAEAWELLAHSYFNQLYRMDATEAQELTFEAAARALAIDPDLVLARALYESASFESFSMLREIEALERAVREQPGNPLALQMLFWDLMINGYLEEGVRLAKRYVEVEPLMLEAHYYLVHVLFAAGRFSEAIAALEVTEQLGDGDANWSYGVMYLVEKRDDVAIAYFEAWLHQHGYSDTSWVRDLVTGARNPATGLAYLDRRIPEIVASMPEDDEFDWQEKLFPWYLYLGFLDRYFETILDLDLTDEAWSYAFIPVAGGTIHRRAGFTAHPKYLEVVEAMGIIDVWEQRGPPDFCEKTGGGWVCE